ncbi:hypothetical protein LRS73_16605 [Methylobacterium currus]|uniref:hypothetical protein n=1 Tax=Methylobacterium currus TaxID=2051553 RepID=UPI001E58C676|nr:hypothetical protein [Methylobacterium currus]UHC14197.1 hypothetical protein LRS73_16605 [Methylobacterium currus]
MTHPPTDPEPTDVGAGELHNLARHRIQGCPAWEDLDPADPLEAGLIRWDYERARDFAAMYVGDEA